MKCADIHDGHYCGKDAAFEIGGVSLCEECANTILAQALKARDEYMAELSEQLSSMQANKKVKDSNVSQSGLYA